MTDDDELELARQAGRLEGEAAPPLPPSLVDWLNTVMQEPMRAVARRHEETGNADQTPRHARQNRRTADRHRRG